MSDKTTLKPADIRAIAQQLLELADQSTANCTAVADDHAKLSPFNLAKIARQHLRDRHARQAYIPQNLLGEPVWDILLDMFILQMEGRHYSIARASVASEVSLSTAERYLNAMKQRNLIVGNLGAIEDHAEPIALSDLGYRKVADCLRNTGESAENHKEDLSPEMALIRNSIV